MEQKRKWKLPAIGMRITKSAVAVLLCYLVSFLRGNSGIVFYSQLAALWCMQVYVSNTKKNALQRFIGTVVGALYGLVYLLLRNEMNHTKIYTELLDAVIISGFIVIVLYTTVLMKKKQASYFSCVVFLSIVVNHVTDTNPYLFVWNRFLDTMIGIIIGIGVNCFSLPKEKRKDILFVSGLDDTLLNKKDNLSDYSKIELNRMLDEGANFTISTMRTPASLMEPMWGIRLKLPVIAMDGAVLYDINENRYLKVYVISNSTSRKVLDLMKQEGLACFTNVIIDDMLVIYYEDTKEKVQEELVKNLRKSPYRNYVKREFQSEEGVVYFMMLYPSEIIEGFYKKLEQQGFTKDLKVLKYKSQDYEGYSYLKIYNKNATKENMIHYLKERTNLSNVVTFGSIKGRYDIVVEPGDTNKMVHMLKKLYEPIKWEKQSRKSNLQEQ
ncbi:MAG: HAD hydrolase family protein [Lachnospiraceae bacterium]|nr:HAD hydrolase family protein [Lachnospiraceae bacterium]